MPQSRWSNRTIALRGVLLVVAVAACTPTTGAPAVSPPASIESAASTAPTVGAVSQPAPTDELLFSGKLLICSDLPYPPQEFFNEQGEPIGSDIEIGQEIARRLGLHAEIVNSIFDSIIPALQAGKCDAVISAQTITEERLAQVDMVPYFKAGQAFMVRKGNPAGIYTELDLCGKRIVAQKGTTEVDYVLGAGDYAEAGLSATCVTAGKPAIALTTTEKDDQALAALKAGRADAYFVDSPAAGYHVVQGAGEFELSGLTLDEAEQGISVSKSKPGLRRALEAGLASMMSDGSYEAILARYGVEDGSLAP
ncbi:MAG TPA: ABC transporter substrate-binding protein [Candidatus Limnocylindrales bacterium]|nr:ABC transporter substrate-binding protein [Candidatus Limnocylindrales bacterium]